MVTNHSLRTSRSACGVRERFSSSSASINTSFQTRLRKFVERQILLLVSARTIHMVSFSLAGTVHGIYATSWRCRSLSIPFISVDVNGPHKEKMHRSHAGACHLHCAVTINYRSSSYNGCCRCATIHARHARSSVHSLDEMTSPRSKVSQRVLPYCHVGTTTNHVISGHITNDLILFSGTLGDPKKSVVLERALHGGNFSAVAWDFSALHCHQWHIPSITLLSPL